MIAFYGASGEGAANDRNAMPYWLVTKTLCLCGAGWLFTFALPAQTVDSTTVYPLAGAEVVEKMRPGTMRSTTPLQQIDREEIDRLGLENVAEAVKRFSGATVKDYGGIGGLKTVSVRSMGAGHTAVSYDGAPVMDFQSGQVDIGRFSLDNVRAVSLAVAQPDEIFQPARMFASAGVLSIMTAKPVFLDGKPYNLAARIQAGSFGLFNSSLRYEHKLDRRWTASLHSEWTGAKGDYPFTLTNGEQISSRKRKNSDVRLLRLEGNLYGALNNGGTLRAKGYYFYSRRGLPGSVIFYNEYAAERLWDTHAFAQVHYRQPIGRRWTFQTQAMYHYTNSHYLDVNDKYAAGRQDDYNRQRHAWLSSGLLARPMERLALTLTSDLSFTSLRNNFIDSPRPVRLSWLTALAAKYLHPRLTATGSLLHTVQADHVSHGDAPPNRWRLSPSVSLSVAPLSGSTLRVRLLYQDIFRVPTFTDLYYLRMGNTGLRPERAAQFNAGLTWSGRVGHWIKHISLSADGYYNRVEDKIVALPTMYIWRMMNFGKVDIRGIDARMDAEMPLAKNFSLLVSSGYSYQKAMDVTSPTAQNYRHQIPYTPRHWGNVSVSIISYITFSWNLAAVGERYALPQNIGNNRMAGYAEHNLSVGKELLFPHYRLRIQAELLNAGNQSYDVIRYYPMPGRSWRVSVNVSY